MTVARPSLPRGDAYRRGPAYDNFVLSVSGAVTLAMIALGIPALAEKPGQADIPLWILLVVVGLLSGVQWMALQMRLGLRPPLIAGLVGIGVTLTAAAFGGQLGAICGLALSFIGCFAWRIVEPSSTRFPDAAVAVAAVALAGFLPAQLLVLRRQDGGFGAFVLVVGAALAFSILQGLLMRPLVDGTRGADLTTVMAAAVAALAGLVLGSLIDGFGWDGGLAVGLAVGVFAAAGQAALGIIAPAALRDGRRVRRRPLFLDALLPLFAAAPAGLFVVRMILAR